MPQALSARYHGRARQAWSGAALLMRETLGRSMASVGVKISDSRNGRLWLQNQK